MTQHAPEQAGFMTVNEVASLLRVSNMTVYRLITAGEIPAARIGKSYRIRRSDVDKYLSDRFNAAG
ncbi:MAG: helix-turn-helix domain-containing protein [Acidimicrobiia bacterium]